MNAIRSHIQGQHCHAGVPRGERPDVGEFRDAPIERAVAVAALGFDADERGLVASGC